MNWILLLVICILLPSCSHKESRSNQYLRKQMGTNNVDIDFAHQQRARYSDIPIPLNSYPNLKSFNRNSSSVIMGYIIPLTLQETKLFYTLEMERLGWQQSASFDGSEVLLNFEKPGYICSVSIRPSTKKKKGKEVELLIFTGAKEPSISA